ncbi:glycosyltransferase family 4 protein [Shewanella baltica]|uniref:glycosyltransferase family 4 protein n=1 Tax=Shewanella baltica TaxID=62322 RepID=UPI00014F8D9A|nr:glycosyltransferase family 1 protein [Shewanella baltica]ABS09026.1 glycosyl transferase group 1 [Shewanella baltica OS185]
MKKIIIDGRCIFASGIGVYVREVLSRLIKFNVFTIEIILLKEQLDDFKKLKISVNKVHLVSFGRYSIKNTYRLNNIICNADLYLMPALSLSPIFSRVKKIVVVHDLCPIALRKIFGTITSFAYAFFLAIQVLSAKRIICISEFTKNELLYYYSSCFRSKVTVIHNGLSTRFKLPEKFCHNTYGKPYLLCVGNIKPHKNIKNLVDFFIQKSKFSTSHDLVIVGNADGFRTGVDFGRNSNENVRFTGFVSDEELACLYRNAAAYVFPSFYEGFGLPILEAMSFKLPIIASDIPVFKEIAGQSIAYFDPHTFADFDDKLKYILDLEYIDYSYNLSLFTWDNCVHKIIGLINEDTASK